jgi:hypothetical protein
MSRGEFLTKMPVWLALAGYGVGASSYLLSRGRRRWDTVARTAWTIGCAGLFAHVLFAFHYYHGWSLTSAYRETARQTAELTGLEWGGGLYINSALLAGWIADVVWWSRGLKSYRARPWRVAAAWHAFLIFIIFNATVVFKTGPLRWMGLGLCLGLTFLWGIVSWGAAPWRMERKPIYKE